MNKVILDQLETELRAAIQAHDTSKGEALISKIAPHIDERRIKNLRHLLHRSHTEYCDDVAEAAKRLKIE